MGCAYCGEANRSSESPGLARVSWPAVSGEALEAALAAVDHGVERICLQGVAGQGTWPFVLESLSSLPQQVPVSLSIRIRSLAEVEKALSLGVEMVSVALDAADAATAHRIGRAGWERDREVLLEAARRYPGRLATHLIAGLGERDDHLLLLLAELLALRVTVGLFAFTPVPGTPLEGAAPPPLARYRRLQAALWLLKSGALDTTGLHFDGEGSLVGFHLPPATLREHLADGQAFETSGCSGCNRPFYNEAPRGPWYNFPRPLTAEEVKGELARIGL